MKRTEEALTPVNPSTSELVSYRNPDGLILSTGNLYFTYHDAATASVWRAAQSALPGQEILLYSEPGARFGDIVLHGGVFAQAWTQCDSQSCRLHFDVPSGEDSLYTIDRNALGVSVASSGNVFWGDATGVHRHIPH
jgi:hypothetical protein